MLDHGTTREALRAVRQRLDEVLRGDGTDPTQVADGLFAVSDLLSDQPALRRALADPSRQVEARQGLARAVLGGRVAEPVVEIAVAAAGARWSSARDLVEALDEVGVEALADAASRAGAGSDAEDELFRFGRLIASSPQLRAALSDRQLPAERKHEVINALLSGRATDVTVRVVQRAVARGATRNVEALLDHYGRVLAARQQRLVALVRCAVALTGEQRERLAAILARAYGRAVHLNVELDPRVLGGVEVRIGDEVVEGTVAERLAEARRQLVG